MGTKWVANKQSDNTYVWIVKNEKDEVVAQGSPSKDKASAEAAFALAREQLLTATAPHGGATPDPALTTEQVQELLRIAASAVRARFVSSPGPESGSTLALEIEDVLRRYVGDIATYREAPHVQEDRGWFKRQIARRAG